MRASLPLTSHPRSSPRSQLTLLVEKLHPAATSSTLQRMRDTVDAAIIMPISSAARNAIATLVAYRALGLPYAPHAALVDPSLSLPRP